MTRKKNKKHSRNTESAAHAGVSDLERHMVPLRAAFAHAAVGDFSVDVSIPEEENEFTELYVGLQVMFEAMREKFTALSDLNEKFADAQAMAHVGHWEWHIETDSVAWSDELCRIFGYKPGHYPTTYPDYINCLHPADREIARQTIKKAAQTGKPYTFYHRVIRPDGDIRDIYSRGRVTLDPQGKILKMSGIAQDVTKARRSAAAERNIAELVKSAKEGIVTRLTDGTIISWNSGAESIFGYSAAEAIGANIMMLAPDEVKSDMIDYTDRLLQGEKYIRVESLRRRKDGRIIHVSSSITPLYDESGNIIGLSSVTRDITKQKELEEEREKLLEEVVRASRMKDNFLATLSHELRNPLVPILSSVELLKLFDREGKEFDASLDLMERQTKHLARLLDDLLDISRIMRGKLTLQKEDVDMRTIAERAIETTRATIEVRDHTLTLRSHPRPLLVCGDPLRLEQILVNILNNAAKFTESGGEISMTISKEVGHVSVRIRDTGRGIAPEILPRIFDDRFSQDHQYTRSVGGLGVGLQLARQLVELHRGGIEARSEGQNKGSEFSIFIPLVPDEILPEETSKENSESKVKSNDISASAEEVPEQRDSPTSAALQAKVLVVDDNPAITDALSRLIRHLGHNVEIAHGGPEALDLARQFQPDVVFLDIGMPYMDGYTVAKELRCSDGLTLKALVAVTGYGQDSDREKSRQAGFDRHITKPVSATDLKQVIEDALAASVI